MPDVPRLFKRAGSDSWYTQVYDSQGNRLQVSTKCRDKKSAEAVARALELQYADPAGHAAATATLGKALQDFVDLRQEEAKAGRKAQDTVDFYKKKSGQLLRVFEYPHATDDALGAHVPLRLQLLDSARVDAYVSVRRGEGAGEHTISKELVTLRGALKLALRRKRWSGSLEAVLPTAFAPEYKPVERALTVDELGALLAELTPDRAAQVAFMAATSAEWSAVGRALRADVEPEGTALRVRGSKRAIRDRKIPIVSPTAQGLLAYALKHAEGDKTDSTKPLFKRWSNVRRDLHDACARAGIAPCSPNDLRRTCATWLRAQGVEPQLIAPIMGHADSRMVEKVYGRLDPKELAKLMSRQMGLPDCSANAADAAETTDGSEQSGQARKNKTPENRGFGVPRAGIEPATRGFSIPEAEWPNPRNITYLARVRARGAAHVQQRPKVRAAVAGTKPR